MLEYSNDGGKTWEGPFSEEEIQNLREFGVVTDASQIRRTQPEVAAPAPAVPTPPAAVANEMYYLNTAGSTPAGPFPLEYVGQMLATGQIPPTCMIWKEGWPEWMPVAQMFAAPAAPPVPPLPDETTKPALVLRDFLADIIGTDHAPTLGVKSFFSEVFNSHRQGEMEAFFCAGGPHSTPKITKFEPPRPWIYARVLLWFIALLIGFRILGQYSPDGLVCYVITLNFAVPFVMLVLFAEMNISRNVSWFKILQMFIVGGILSLLFTLIIQSYTGNYELYWAGPVEETAKLAACLVVAGSQIRKGGVLQGLLCGAAVGAGFAIPESIQYFMNYLIGSGGSLEIALGTSYTRAILSPIMHLLYTPIVAAAAWRLLQDKPFSFQFLGDFRFYRLALVGILLHSFWNAPILHESLEAFLLKIGIVIVIGWTVLLLMLREGVDKLRVKHSAEAQQNEQ